MSSSIFWTWLFTTWLLLGIWVHYKVFQNAYIESNTQQTVNKD